MIPALAAIAAGAGLKYVADRGASKRRESIRRSMESYQRLKARENEAAVEQLIAKQTPDARGAELAEVTAGREKSMGDSVGAAQAFDAPGIAGNLPAEYKAAQEAEAGRIAERTRRAIEQLATMGAPSEQQQKFGIRFGRSAGTVDAANRAADYVGRSYMSDIENVRPNALMSILGDAGMSAGSSMLLAGAGKAPAAPSVVGDFPTGGDTAVAAAPGSSRIGPRLKHGFGLWGLA